MWAFTMELCCLICVFLNHFTKYVSFIQFLAKIRCCSSFKKYLYYHHNTFEISTRKYQTRCLEYFLQFLFVYFTPLYVLSLFYYTFYVSYSNLIYIKTRNYSMHGIATLLVQKAENLAFLYLQKCQKI